jgi:putative ABC transport system substrate-binding protein
MDRRAFLAGTGAMLLAAPLAARAQQARKIVRVGIVLGGPTPSPEEIAKAAATSPFLLAMKELGWIEGQNMVVERRYGDSPDQRRAAIAALVRLQVDVLLVSGVAPARLAQLETKTIPIVVVAGGDLVANRLVASVARPGGNLTGLQARQDDLGGKRLELLKLLVPNLSRVATFDYDVSYPGVPQGSVLYGQKAAEAARTLGLELHPLFVRQPGEIAGAFLDMVKNRDQGLLVFPSNSATSHRQEIIDLAAKHRIATIYPSQFYVQAGGLISYGVNDAETSRRAAVYMDKILRGAKPGELPIEQASKFELVINLKTAKALSLTIPPSLLGRADEVIQ